MQRRRTRSQTPDLSRRADVDSTGPKGPSRGRPEWWPRLSRAPNVLLRRAPVWNASPSSLAWSTVRWPASRLCDRRWVRSVWAGLPDGLPPVVVRAVRGQEVQHHSVPELSEEALRQLARVNDVVGDDEVVAGPRSRPREVQRTGPPRRGRARSAVPAPARHRTPRERGCAAAEASPLDERRRRPGSACPPTERLASGPPRRLCR